MLPPRLPAVSSSFRSQIVEWSMFFSLTKQSINQVILFNHGHIQSIVDHSCAIWVTCFRHSWGVSIQDSIDLHRCYFQKQKASPANYHLAMAATQCSNATNNKLALDCERLPCKMYICSRCGWADKLCALATTKPQKNSPKNLGVEADVSLYRITLYLFSIVHMVFCFAGASG